MIFEKVEHANLLTSYFWGNGVKSNENTFDFVDFWMNFLNLDAKQG